MTALMKTIYQISILLLLSICQVSAKKHIDIVVVDICGNKNKSIKENLKDDSSRLCIFDSRFKERVPVLTLQKGDSYSSISKSPLIKRKNQPDLLIVELSVEPDGLFPTHKVIVLTIEEERVIPVLITHSWGPHYLTDVNNDGILDIELYKNPFNIETSRLYKWPILIDGASMSSEFALSEIPTYIEFVTAKMEKQIDVLKNECKLIAEDKEFPGVCFEQNDIEKLELQVREIKHQFEK